jgi:uncharacterized protein
MSKTVPVQEGIFSWPPTDDPKLFGGCCNKCGIYNFPFQSGCPACGDTSIERVELGGRGTLFTWTSQNYPPPAPPYLGVVDEASFKPYAAGYVELPGKIRVASRLTENSADKLRIGMEMALKLIPLCTDKDGNEVLTFAFAPTGA